MPSESAQKSHVEHKKTSRSKISKQNSVLLSKENNLGAKEIHSDVRKKTCNWKKSLFLPTSVICLEVEQFDIVPVPVYSNNSLSTQSVTTKELPKYQADHVPYWRVKKGN